MIVSVCYFRHYWQIFRLCMLCITVPLDYEKSAAKFTMLLVCWHLVTLYFQVSLLLLLTDRLYFASSRSCVLRLVQQYKLLYKPMAKSTGEGKFDSLRLRNPWTDFDETWNV